MLEFFPPANGSSINALLHGLAGAMCLGALPHIYWAIPLSGFFFISWRFSQKHLRLNDSHGVSAVKYRENRWDFLDGTREVHWAEQTHRYFISRYFIYFSFVSNGREYRQLLLPSMCETKAYRELCRWLLTQENEPRPWWLRLFT